MGPIHSRAGGDVLMSIYAHQPEWEDFRSGEGHTVFLYCWSGGGCNNGCVYVRFTKV